MNNTCCSTSFSDYVVQCPDSITIHTLNLDPSTPYLVKILSPVFGAIEVEATTDADGYLVIDIDELPDGFIQAFSGSFNFSVYPLPADGEQIDACIPINLLLAKYYDAVTIEVKIGTLTKSKIGCPLPSEG